MTTRSDPNEWHVASDRDGFYIEDEYGEDVTPGWRFTSLHDAECSLADLVANALENYEPPDPPGWEGGFAENH